MNCEKTTLPSLRNIEWRKLKIETEKINQILLHIPTNNITEVNELIYAGAKLVCEKIGIPPKKHEQKVKTKMGNSTGNANKKPTKTGQNDKTKERRWNMREQKGKATREKIIQLEEINQKVLAKEGRLKRYRQRVKQYKQNRTFQNNERKFYQHMEWHENIPTTGCQRYRTILDKNMATKKYNERAEWVNNITRKLEGLEDYMFLERREKEDLPASKTALTHRYNDSKTT